MLNCCYARFLAQVGAFKQDLLLEIVSEFVLDHGLIAHPAGAVIVGQVLIRLPNAFLTPSTGNKSQLRVSAETSVRMRRREGLLFSRLCRAAKRTITATNNAQA
jgi:hypothetical protein